MSAVNKLYTKTSMLRKHTVVSRFIFLDVYKRQVLYGNGAYSSYYTVYKQEIARKKRENSRTHYANTVLSVLFFITAFISILSVTVVTVMFLSLIHI